MMAISTVTICLCALMIQEVNTIYEIFDSEWSLAKKAYKHKAVHAVELMYNK